MIAKQSTSLTVVVGPILDSTGAEYASAVIGDLSISKNGGTLTAMAAAATLTYIANGMYTLVTTTSNMDTLGAVQVTCNKATYQMPKMERNVVPASVYDAIITNATNATGGLPTATAAISAFAGAVSTLTAGGVRAELAPELGRIDQTIGSRATQTSLDAVASYVDTEVAAIKAKTDNLPSDPADASDVATSFGAVNSTLSTIASYVDTEVAAIKAKTDLIEAFPANFSSMVINGVNGHVAVVVHAFQNGVLTAAAIAAGALNGKGDWLTTLGASAPANWINAAAIADGAIDAGSIADNALNGKGNWLTSLGANAPAGWINAASITTDAITNDKIAASAVTKISTGVSNLEVLTRLASMIESDGAGQFRFDTIAVSLAVGGGAGGAVNITVEDRSITVT